MVASDTVPIWTGGACAGGSGAGAAGGGGGGGGSGGADAGGKKIPGLSRIEATAAGPESGIMFVKARFDLFLSVNGE